MPSSCLLLFCTHWAGRLVPSNPTVFKETQHLPFSQEEGANRITCMGTEDTFLFSSSSKMDTRKLKVPRKGSEVLFNSRISVPVCKWDNDYSMPSQAQGCQRVAKTLSLST